MSKTIIMTPTEGDKLINGIAEKLKLYALEGVISTKELSALNRRDAAQLIREAVLEYEEARLAAGRKPPKVV